MAEITIRIADLESILVNCRDDHIDEELQEFEDELSMLEQIQDLWDAFGDVPMDPETECIESEFKAVYSIPSEFGGDCSRTFPAGTHREDVWHWFEETFHISVAEDLMY